MTANPWLHLGCLTLPQLYHLLSIKIISVITLTLAFTRGDLFFPWHYLTDSAESRFIMHLNVLWKSPLVLHIFKLPSLVHVLRSLCLPRCLACCPAGWRGSGDFTLSAACENVCGMTLRGDVPSPERATHLPDRCCIFKQHFQACVFLLSTLTQLFTWVRAMRMIYDQIGSLSCWSAYWIHGFLMY